MLRRCKSEWVVCVKVEMTENFGGYKNARGVKVGDGSSFSERLLALKSVSRDDDETTKKEKVC